MSFFVLLVLFYELVRVMIEATKYHAKHNDSSRFSCFVCFLRRGSYRAIWACFFLDKKNAIFVFDDMLAFSSRHMNSFHLIAYFACSFFWIWNSFNMIDDVVFSFTSSIQISINHPFPLLFLSRVIVGFINRTSLFQKK